MLAVGPFDHAEGAPCPIPTTLPSSSYEELHMKMVLAMGLAVGLLGVSAVGAADSNEPGLFRLPVIKIVGRVTQPQAAIEVNRLKPDLGVRDPSRSFLSQTESAVRSDPF
jgi:hypothetical protein